MKTKALAMLLAVCMVLSVLPAAALAAQPQRSGAMVPGSVGTLEPAAVMPNAKSYAVALTGVGPGVVELLVDNPVQAGTEVYFLANPDDGYLAEIYYSGLDEDALVYVGADVVGFIMPARKVTLEVRFVPAEGESHSVHVHENGCGDYVLSRTAAQEGESILMAVQARDNGAFDPKGHIWVTGAPLYYLYEDAQTGVHYYELIMGSEDVKVFLSYKRTGPYNISFWYEGDPNGGTASAKPQKAYINDLVTVTIKPNPGYRLVSAKAVSFAGDLCSELTPIGADQYTFLMHPAGVEIHVVFEAEVRQVRVSVETGLGGAAAANVSQAKVGETVRVTCTPQAGYRVARVTGAEDITDLGGGVYSFVMPAEDVNIQVLFLRHDNPFLDVNEKHYYYSSVLWAVEEGITSGMSADTFAPLAHCTRSQAVTFLWRAAGSPEPADIRCPFTDVPAGSYYEKAVLWALEQGITTGTTPTTFDPDGTCIRSQVATFLWRAQGKPAPGTADNPFTDVEERDYYYQAVLWARENGVTTGTTSTTFDPYGLCQRSQVVTFLYRTAQIS